MPLAGMDWLPAIWFGGGLFGVSILLAGYLTPRYSHFHQSLSELGERNSPHGWLVRWMGFVPLGLSFVIFARQSGDFFSNSIPSVIFHLVGISIIIAGIFPTDPHNRRDTLAGKVHAVSVISVLVFTSLAPFALAVPALYRNPPTIWFLGYSFVMGVLALTLLLFSGIDDSRMMNVLLRLLPESFISSASAPHGLIQRLLLSLHFIWWLTFSLVVACPR